MSNTKRPGQRVFNTKLMQWATFLKKSEMTDMTLFVTDDGVSHSMRTETLMGEEDIAVILKRFMSQKVMDNVESLQELVDELKTQVGTLQKDKDELHTRVRELQAKVGTLQKDKDELHTRVRELQAKVHSVTRLHDDTQLERNRLAEKLESFEEFKEALQTIMDMD